MCWTMKAVSLGLYKLPAILFWSGGSCARKGRRSGILSDLAAGSGAGGL